MSNIRLFIIKLSSELNAVKRINRLSLFNLLCDQYVPICHFHVEVVIVMLAIVPSFVLFYLRYVSYVSFYCRLVFQFEPAYG